jgi:hypothetical protein
VQKQLDAMVNDQTLTRGFYFDALKK